MAKFGLKAGDKIKARSPQLREEGTGKVISSGEQYGVSLTVTKTFSHGVRTKEKGYIHNNCILSKEE